MWRIECADVMDWCAEYSGEPFHSILCDPPYNLDTITKRFGKPGSAPAKHGTDGAFTRASTGFMGARWDDDVAFRPETWVALAKHLHPGGFGLVFGSPRTWHRLATAIEDAGMVLHPTIFCWANSQSMPKASRIDVPLDKGAGAEQEFIPDPQWAGQTVAIGGRGIYHGVAENKRGQIVMSTPLAAMWEGHRYGRQAIKGAVEPILCFQKPYEFVWSDDWHTFSGWSWWHYPKDIKNTPAERLKILKKYGVRIPAAHVEYKPQIVRRRALHKGADSDVLLVRHDVRQDRKRPVEPKLIGRADAKRYRRWKITHSAACIAMTGAGAFNIDAGRLETTDSYNINRWDDGAKPFGGGAGHPYTSTRVDPTRDGEASAERRYNDKGSTNFAATPGPRGGSPDGRWPPNLILTHSPACHLEDIYAGPDGPETMEDWICADGCAVAALNAQAGPRKSGYMKPGQQRQASLGKGGYHDGMPDEATASGTYGDKGPTSRYFFNADWHHEVAEQIAGANPVFYQAKAGTREKEAGLGGDTDGGPKQEAANRVRRRNSHPT